LSPRLLLDTHVIIRWLFEPRKLSRTQLRELEAAVRRGEPVAFSAISLMEIALLWGAERLALSTTLDTLFQDLMSHPAFRLLPLTFDVALETPYLANLRDPADRTIAATARVHRLRLVTSDRRIVESGLVPVID
jgi:PIN domain nuclease of toxin-antitoxin system